MEDDIGIEHEILLLSVAVITTSSAGYIVDFQANITSLNLLHLNAKIVS